MLKETKTEEAIVFFVTFLSLVAFQLGKARAPNSHGYAYARFGWLKFCGHHLAITNNCVCKDFAVDTLGKRSFCRLYVVIRCYISFRISYLY